MVARVPGIKQRGEDWRSGGVVFPRSVLKHIWFLYPGCLGRTQVLNYTQRSSASPPPENNPPDFSLLGEGQLQGSAGSAEGEWGFGSDRSLNSSSS